MLLVQLNLPTDYNIYPFNKRVVWPKNDFEYIWNQETQSWFKTRIARFSGGDEWELESD